MSTYNFPPTSSLPETDGLPDHFLKPDGSRVQNQAEWPAQREYSRKCSRTTYSGICLPSRAKG